MSDAREAVLGAVRAACSAIRDRPPAPERPAVAPGAPAPVPDPAIRVALFAERLAELGVHVHRAQDEVRASEVLARVTAQVGAGDIALSDSDLVRRLCADLDPPTFDAWTDRERLVEAGLGVTGVQAAIAETGTLVLCSTDERHRLASLVPPVHLAIVREGQVLGDLDEALARVAQGGLPPLVTFVSGPSRTADIELTLVVGVHGPRELHVLLLP